MNQEKVGNKGPEGLFYDTYALYAIVKGEGNYRPFIKNHLVKTTLMNLYELYYNLIKENQHELAELSFERLKGSCMDIHPDIIKSAAKFRAENIKKRLSYIDCLGYVLAKNNRIKFLTGDKEFEGLSNVKFVK
jgi:uncharacterized protein